MIRYVSENQVVRLLACCGSEWKIIMLITEGGVGGKNHPKNSEEAIFMSRELV